MHGMRALRVTVILAALGSLPAAALTNEVTSVGKATLGQSRAQVQKAYPKMQPTNENLGSQPFSSEYLERFVVTDFVVPETRQKGVMELRFWKGKLWAIIVYYGDGNDAKVIEAFTARMGPPNGTNPAKPGWNGDKSQNFVETERHWYGITDNEISKDAQAWFYARLRAAQGGAAAGQSAPAPTPPVAPPATAPAAAPAK